MSSLTATSPSTAALAPSTAPARRHLRVGVIQRGRLVEERLLRAPRAVTLGPAPGDTFVTPPDDDFAGSWRLFETKRGRLVLRLADGMQARLANGGEIETLEGPCVVIVSDAARGKVTRGETTLLFQLVRPPTPQPRPQLPASVRRHVVAELDGVFTGIAALSFLVHLAMVIYLRQVDWPRQPAIDELPDRFVQMVRRPQPIEKPRPVATAPAAKPTPAKPAQPKPTTGPTPAAKPAPSAAERHANLGEQVRKMGLLAFIGQRSDDPSAMRDLLANGTADQSVEKALAGVNGVTTAGAETLRNLPKATGTGRVATPSDLRGAARIADATDVGPASERAARSIVHEGAPQVEDGKVDASVIAREIRARRKAVAACYERALKTQPTLAGKLVVRFSLSAAGTVTATEIDDDTLGSPDVAACIRATVLRWRFPALAEGPAELSFPFVFQPGG
jgi:hypothetical protein